MESHKFGLTLETGESTAGPFSTDFYEGIATNLTSLPTHPEITTIQLPLSFI